MVRAALFLGLLAVPLLARAQEAGPAADSAGVGRAGFSVTQERGRVVVWGLFTGTEAAPDSLHYELEAQKEGPTGTSTTRQSGAFDVLPNEAVQLSSLTLGVGPGDAVRLRLTIRTAAGDTVATAQEERMIMGKL